MGFARFMSSTSGRLLRVVVGLALVVIGSMLGQGLGIALIVIGLVAIGTGLFDVCLLAPLFKLPMSGKKVREHFAKQPPDGNA